MKHEEYKMKNFLLSFVLFSSLHSMERHIPYREHLLTHSEEEVKREEAHHFSCCKHDKNRLCEKAIEYAKACNPLVLVHSSPISINFTTSEGKTLLDLILKNKDRNCLEKKIALSSIFIQKGINIFHKSHSSSAIRKIIKEQNVILFQHAWWTISIKHYKKVLQYLMWHYEQNEARFEDFTRTCTTIMIPLIQNIKKPSDMPDEKFYEIKRHTEKAMYTLLMLLPKTRTVSPTPSIDPGSDEECE